MARVAVLAEDSKGSAKAHRCLQAEFHHAAHQPRPSRKGCPAPAYPSRSHLRLWARLARCSSLSAAARSVSRLFTSSR